QQYGVVPWATLGLTASDIEDGWGGRFTYRVGPDMVLDGALDFSSCDPAGSGPINATAPVPPWCTAAGTGAGQCNSSTLATNCTSPNNALTQSTTKGLVVENTSGAILMDPRNGGTPPVSTGAAYVVVSHGPEGGGAYDGNGILQGSPVSAGTMEAKNFADVAYSAPPASPAASPTWFLVDGAANATTSAAHFDDLVSRPGILSLSNRAQLGPRSH
ncbi:MAG TPA: hypothetical protein VFP36_08110, partial [Usitatibacter sp.]|nr:hypothetical protein [Usitatibacter sp.]